MSAALAGCHGYAAVARRIPEFDLVWVVAALLRVVCGLQARDEGAGAVAAHFVVVVAFEVLAGAGAVLGDVVDVLNGLLAVGAIDVGSFAVVLGDVTEEAIGVLGWVFGLP